MEQAQVSPPAPVVGRGLDKQGSPGQRPFKGRPVRLAETGRAGQLRDQEGGPEPGALVGPQPVHPRAGSQPHRLQEEGPGAQNVPVRPPAAPTLVGGGHRGPPPGTLLEIRPQSGGAQHVVDRRSEQRIRGLVVARQRRGVTGHRCGPSPIPEQCGRLGCGAHGCEDGHAVARHRQRGVQRLQCLGAALPVRQRRLQDGCRLRASAAGDQQAGPGDSCLGVRRILGQDCLPGLPRIQEQQRPLFHVGLGSHPEQGSGCPGDRPGRTGARRPARGCCEGRTSFRHGPVEILFGVAQEPSGLLALRRALLPEPHRGPAQQRPGGGVGGIACDDAVQFVHRVLEPALLEGGSCTGRGSGWSGAPGRQAEQQECSMRGRHAGPE